MKQCLQVEQFLKGHKQLSTDNGDKEKRILRLSTLKKDFLAGHPGEECVIQVTPLPACLMHLAEAC